MTKPQIPLHKLSAALFIYCLFAPVAGAQTVAEIDIKVLATSVALNPEQPDSTIVGRLKYRGGLHLTASHESFGGISGLVVSKNGRQFLAITDRGMWLTGQLYYRDGQLIDIDDTSLAPISDNSDTRVIGVRADAEALALTPDGVLYIGYEQDHRIVQHFLSDTDDLRGALYSRPTPLPHIPELNTVPLNGGFEALVPLGRNLLLAVTEKRRDFVGNLYGWLLYNNVYAPLKYAAEDGFSPVEFALLPNGDVLTLERRYSILSGVAVRLCIIVRADIRAGQSIPCTQIAELKPPMNVDNFEGMAVRQADTGETLVYLISDDNFNRDPQTGQRTLLLMFELLDAP